jgi:hypothetical protein
MGQSRESKQINEDLRRQQELERQRSEALWNRYTTEADASQGRSNALLDESLTGYRSLLSDIDNSGAFGTYSELAQTGGYSPETLRSLQGNVDAYKRFASGVDITPEDRARMRGGGVYDEYSRTGGWDDARTRDFRQRAGSVIPSFYDALKNELSRMNVAQGGYNPGYGAQTRALSRDASRQAEAARLAAEVELANSRDAGRRWGTEGMTASEKALQELLGNRFVQGMGGATATEMGVADSVRQGRLAGAGGLNDTTTQKQRALDSIAALRGQTPGEVAMFTGALNNSTANSTSAANQTLQTRAAYNPNKGFWDRLTDLVGVAAPIAAAFIPGGSPKPKKRIQSTGEFDGLFDGDNYQVGG